MKSLSNLFLPYELALIAKQKGFNEPCLGYWEIDNLGTNLFIPSHPCRFEETAVNQVTAPLYQQVIDWLRDEYNLHISMQTIVNEPNNFGWSMFKGAKYSCENSTNESGKNYYEALAEAIEQAFKLIPDTKNIV